MRKFLQLFFRNRETGAITIVQAPNLVLWVVIAAAVLRWIGPADADAILTAAVKVGLLIWAVDEILRGVNPWRRCLGAAVFCYALVTLL